MQLGGVLCFGILCTGGLGLRGPARCFRLQGYKLQVKCFLPYYEGWRDGGAHHPLAVAFGNCLSALVHHVDT